MVARLLSPSPNSATPGAPRPTRASAAPLTEKRTSAELTFWVLQVSVVVQVGLDVQGFGLAVMMPAGPPPPCCTRSYPMTSRARTSEDVAVRVGTALKLSNASCTCVGEWVIQSP